MVWFGLHIWLSALVGREQAAEKLVCMECMECVECGQEWVSLDPELLCQVVVGMM